MTGYTRHDLPCDIVVYAGDFADQPAVFAHLLTTCPELDLGEVEVIRGATTARLAARFDGDTVARVIAAASGWSTIVLILPAAYGGVVCPLRASSALPYLGTWRGRIPHMVADRSAP